MVELYNLRDFKGIRRDVGVGIHQAWGSIPKSLNVKDDALIYKNIKSNIISLQSSKHNHGINFHSSNWEYFAFWTKKDAVQRL